MDIKIESESSVKKKIHVSLPETRVQEEMDNAYKTFRRQAQVPGFRKGKVPLDILKQRFGKSVEGEVLTNLLQDSMREAMEKENLEPIHVSEVKPERKEGKGFSYEASLELKPQFEPKDYMGVSLKDPKTAITDKEVSEALEILRKDQAVLKTNESLKTPSSGHFVVMSLMEISEVGGDPVHPDKEPETHSLEVGGGLITGQVEKDVCKMKLGEMKDLTFELAHQGGKKLFYRCTLKEIKETVLPDVDDDFAKSVGPFDDLAALKAKIQEDLEHEAQHKDRREMTGALLETLLKKNPVDLPPVMVEHELDNLQRGVYQQMIQQGIQQMPEGHDNEKMRKDLRPDALKRVHQQLVLEAIAKKESIEVDDKEIRERIQKQAQAQNMKFQELYAHYEKNNLIDGMHFEILTGKTIEHLLDNAKTK